MINRNEALVIMDHMLDHGTRIHGSAVMVFTAAIHGCKCLSEDEIEWSLGGISSGYGNGYGFGLSEGYSIGQGNGFSFGLGFGDSAGHGSYAIADTEGIGDGYGEGYGEGDGHGYCYSYNQKYDGYVYGYQLNWDKP